MYCKSPQPNRHASHKEESKRSNDPTTRDLARELTVPEGVHDGGVSLFLILFKDLGDVA